MARIACVQRLFVVLFAFVAFSALPGVAPLLAASGKFGPDSSVAARAYLSATEIHHDTAERAERHAGHLLIAAYWRNLSLIFAHDFHASALHRPMKAGARAPYRAIALPLAPFDPLALPTASYDAQAPPRV